jgi:hypothetical protein
MERLVRAVAVIKALTRARPVTALTPPSYRRILPAMLIRRRLRAIQERFTTLLSLAHGVVVG